MSGCSYRPSWACNNVFVQVTPQEHSMQLRSVLLNSTQSDWSGSDWSGGCPTSENGLAAEPTAAANCYSTALLNKIRLQAEHTSSARPGFRSTRYRYQLEHRSVAFFSALRCWLRLSSHRFVLLCRPKAPSQSQSCTAHTGTGALLGDTTSRSFITIVCEFQEIKVHAQPLLWTANSKGPSITRAFSYCCKHVS